MLKNQILFLSMSLFLMILSCTKEEVAIEPIIDSSDEVENITVNGAFDEIILPSVCIKGHPIYIEGTIEGDIDLVKLYINENFIRANSIINNRFKIAYTPESEGNLELNLIAYSNKGDQLDDTLCYSKVFGPKKSAFDLNNRQNKLGLWIWYLEETGYSSHEEIANRISLMGVKRALIKVADGTSIWPEAKNIAYENNEAFLDFYKNNGLEIFAWSYNYPNNEEAQSEALYEAAKAGFDGYVLDIEVEFDGKYEKLDAIMFAFYLKMLQAINEGYIDENFSLIVTTWGNPKDHNMNIGIIDKYVDAHMPQTYFEKWGGEWLTNPENSIDVGNAEYASLGATKPVFHIISAEKVGSAAIHSDILNRAIKYGGPHVSIWKIPGSNMGTGWERNWSILEQLEWNYDFL